MCCPHARARICVCVYVCPCPCRYPEQYAAAYVSLALPRILAPYVQLECVTWLAPAVAGGGGAGPVEAMSWYATWADYACETGDDGNLIPLLVERVRVA